MSALPATYHRPDDPPRPWSLTPRQVHGGWAVYWTRWNSGAGGFEEAVSTLDPTLHATEAEASEAIALHRRSRTPLGYPQA